MNPMRIWLAGVLVAVGALWLLDAADVLDAGSTLDRWWPVAVIALALVAAAVERRVSLGPSVLFVIGVLLLIDHLGAVDVGAIFWPVVAIVAGVWLLLHRGHWVTAREQTADRQDVVALFGASHARNRSDHFRHANATGVFGGATVDLREARPEPGARVDALALFGGVDILVPPGWRVQMGGLPIFGGFEDKTHGADLPVDAPVLHVSATAIFGGVTVRSPALV